MAATHMEQAQFDYLRKLVGFPTDVALEVNEMAHLFKKTVGTVKDCFISEYQNEDGTREFESAWLFSEDTAVEFRLKQSMKFDAIKIAKRVTRWEITLKAYDFEETATENSRLSIHFTTNAGMAGVLKASGFNCDKLKDIFEKYIKNSLD